MPPAFDLEVDSSLVLLIDVQERFTTAIPGITADGDCGRACALLLKGAKLLDIPVIISEQYPAGLGHTVPHLADADATVVAKVAFSCCDDDTLREELAKRDRDYIIVAGIESHVCVLATVDDLQRRGYQVVVAADAVASRDPAHVELALATMRQLGALVLPVESILFRWQRLAGGSRFKELSRLVR